jgi:dihydrofolate reductase
MRNLVSFMHVSLDGFVAGPKGEMDWIIVDNEIFDYAGGRTNESDGALYGRVTYQMMQAYWPTAGVNPNASKHDIEHSAWYNKVDKVVISRTMKGKNLPKTTIISDKVASQVLELKQHPGKNIMIFGSPSITHLLTQAKLIDDYWLFVNPVLLGHGIPMFKGIKSRTNLQLLRTHSFSSGVVCLHYGLDK